MQCDMAMVLFMVYFIQAVRTVFDTFIDLVFYMIYGSKKFQIKPPQKKFLTQSATNLAKRILNKELSSVEVVSAYIERIKEVNSLLNAVVCDNFTKALEEAKGVDEFLKTTSLSPDEIRLTKPFLGVPFTTKESVAVKDMPFTFGMLSRRKEVAAEDSYLISRLRSAGGILIATTNIPEFNLWCETRCNVYGQTNNPYDLTRTVGGSSGGEACIVSVCGSAIGLGTDIGGSTRMPAYFCGVFGHKPSSGLMSTKGIAFRTGAEDDTTMVTGGPICRFSEDITPFLKLLLLDPSKLKLDEKVDMKTVRVMYVLQPGELKVSPVSREIQNAILKAAKYLSTVTAGPADRVDLPGFRVGQSLWRHEMSKEDNFAFNLGNQKEEVTLKSELPKFLTGNSDHTLACILRLIDLNVLPKTNEKWAERALSDLKNALLDLLDTNGVLLFPSCPTDAPYHYESYLRPWNFAYWAIFNALRFPVTQVPLGLSKNGLPIGCQVVAAPNNDHLTIAVARELEQGLGGWVPPFVSK